MTDQFPSGFFDDYSGEGVASDLVLKRAIEAEPGACIHLASLENAPDAPEGWDAYLKRKAAQLGIIDTITIVLYKDVERSIGAGLTLWRLKPHRKFTTKEVLHVARTGSLWAAAFKRVLSTWSVDGDEDPAIGAAPGKVICTGSVHPDGTIIDTGEDLTAQLASLFGDAPEGNPIPPPLSHTVAALVRDLNANTALGFASRDIQCHRGSCRIYVARTGGQAPYMFTITRDAVYPDLSNLLNAGFTQRDIEILDLIQRGCTDAQVANACCISKSGVRKHLNKIAARLGASGRVETVSRAIATCRNIEEKTGSR